MRSYNSQFVYIIRAGNYYKVGSSTRPKVRLSLLQCGCPLTMELIYTLEVPNMGRAEKLIHSLFEVRHVRGEWFRFTKKEFKDVLGYVRQCEPFLKKGEQLPD